MLESLGAEALRETLITFRTTLRAHMEGINRLNVYPVPDGDTGTNTLRLFLHTHKYNHERLCVRAKNARVRAKNHSLSRARTKNH